VDGLVVIVGGALAVFGAVRGPGQGGDLGLLLGGVGGILIGLLMVFRSRLELVKTVLAGLTAGYFALQLSVFQVATTRCDINEVAPECRGLVSDPTPYGAFDGPLVLAAILVVFLLFEPLLRQDRSVATAALQPVSPALQRATIDSLVIDQPVIDHTPPAPLPRRLPASTDRPPTDRRVVSAFAAGTVIAGILGILAAFLARAGRRR
jgi:hypothetical protein